MPASRAACFHRRRRAPRGRRPAASATSDAPPPPPVPSPPKPACWCGGSGGRSPASVVIAPAQNSSRWKYRSKHSSNRCFSSGVLASTRPSVSFSRSRSAKPTTCTARAASMPSAGGDAQPGAAGGLEELRGSQRRLPPTSRKGRGVGHPLRGVGAHRQSGLLLRLLRQVGDLLVRHLDVRLELQQHVQRVAHQVGVERRGVQQHQHARPVDGLADRRQLLQVQRAQLLHEATSSRRRLVSMPGTRMAMMRAFQLRIRKADMQVQAAPLQRIAQVARAVRGQQHDRRHHRLHACRSPGW